MQRLQLAVFACLPASDSDFEKALLLYVGFQGFACRLWVWDKQHATRNQKSEISSENHEINSVHTARQRWINTSSCGWKNVTKRKYIYIRCCS